MKLIDVRHDDIPDNNNPYNKISIPIGDRLINDVLNGGYNVIMPGCRRVDMKLSLYALSF